MIAASVREQLAEIAGVVARFEESMALHTTYRCGGTAAIWLAVETADGLVAAMDALEQAGVRWVIVGNGSNVLFADEGFDGAVLHLGAEFDRATVTRNALGPGQHRLEAGAAMSITRLLRVARDEDVAGVEFLGGVPGTVGGAIRMNAGTVMGEVKDSLESACVCVVAANDDTTSARLRWLPAGDLGLAYRHSELPPGAVVTAARFRTTDADPAMRTRLAEVLAYRKSTQPLQLPSCGSVFANPPGDHAGRLIEAAGLKEHRIGGAEVSTQHANWIVNVGGARAGDVRALIELCQQTVRERFGVVLRPEVRLLGDWPGDTWTGSDVQTSEMNAEEVA